MAIIKYYDLESRSCDVVNSLTANLMKHMLSEKSVKGLLAAHIEETVEAEAKALQAQPDNASMYDSGEFDVLYRNSKTIQKKKWRFFSKSIPEYISTELVVKATPLDIIALQNYLGSSGFDVLEARTVSRATLSFASDPCHPDTAETLRKHIEEMVAKQNHGLESSLAVSKGVVWDKKTGDSCKGTLYGDAEQILRLRSIIIKMGANYGADIKNAGVSFSY